MAFSDIFSFTIIKSDTYYYLKFNRSKFIYSSIKTIPLYIFHDKIGLIKYILQIIVYIKFDFNDALYLMFGSYSMYAG